MKTGIIGLPQVGKTSLFRILTKTQFSEHAYSNPREAHVGIAKVPDDRLDRLAALFHPKKLTHASVSTLTSAPLDKKLSKKVPTSVTYELSTRWHTWCGHSMISPFRMWGLSIRCGTLKTSIST